MKVGFGKVDITPRVGVELCGFGPFVTRHSIAVRDRLWAKAMAFEQEGTRAVVVSCDLAGVNPDITKRVRQLVTNATSLPAAAVMVHCTHTHSGPNAAGYIGWGAPDEPYLEILPQRIAKACIEAVEGLEDASLAHAEVPCEGIGQNREYDRDALPVEEVLQPDWRPNKPELTDTTCHVVTAHADGKLLGFFSYFGCHPVVCCSATRYIHGDYCGVAMSMLERENPGSIGLFLQGAQGDVNTCVVHKPEQDSLLALDIVAARYANAVRAGLRAVEPIEVDGIACISRGVEFSRKQLDMERLREMLAENEAILHAPGATDEDRNLRMATVYALALRRLIDKIESGQSVEPATELHGIRIGPLALLGSGFEVFQAIKNEIRSQAKSPVTLVMGLTDDSVGYAPDKTAAERGGYAADTVPLILGSLPFANIHEELVQRFVELEAELH